MCLVIGLWAQTVKNTICLNHKDLSVLHPHAVYSCLLVCSLLSSQEVMESGGNEKLMPKQNVRGACACPKPDRLISGTHMVEGASQLIDVICGPLQACPIHTNKTDVDFSK